MAEELAEDKTEVKEVRAQARFVRISPSKIKELTGLIKGKTIKEALDTLRFSPKRGAKIVSKVLNSAVNNAERNTNLKRELLYISQAKVDEGPALKRFRPRALGRASPIRKRMSHITIKVKEKE